MLPGALTGSNKRSWILINYQKLPLQGFEPTDLVSKSLCGFLNHSSMQQLSSNFSHLTFSKVIPASKSDNAEKSDSSSFDWELQLELSSFRFQIHCRASSFESNQKLVEAKRGFFEKWNFVINSIDRERLWRILFPSKMWKGKSLRVMEQNWNKVRIL